MNNDLYSGTLNYKSDGTGSAPWFDWAPYLWAAGVNQRSDGLNWCNWSTRSDFRCINDQGDVRFGDLDSGYTQFYGDQNHPTGWGTAKVAGQLLKWIQGSLPSNQSYLSDWLGVGTPTPWIQK